MLKLHGTVGRSGGLFVATFLVLAMTAMGIAGVTSAAPLRHQSLRAWLNTRGVLMRRSHPGGRLAHTAIVGGNQISIEQAPWQVVVFGFIEKKKCWKECSSAAARSSTRPTFSPRVTACTTQKQACAYRQTM